MEQPAKLKSRIHSLGELRDLFRALRVLAASHVQEARSALPAIQRYVSIIEDAIRQGVALTPTSILQAPLPRHENQRVILAICAEQGFAGALNERILEQAETMLAENDRLLVIGQRGALAARERKMPITKSFAMASHIEGIATVTARLSQYLSSQSHVDLVYAQYQKGGRYEITTKGLLPLDLAAFKAETIANPPLIQMPPDELLQYLTSEYLYAQLVHIMTEALASENGARLRLMEAADQNIADKLNTLSRRERQLRQETITSELLEIISGAEAVRKKQSRQKGQKQDEL